MTELNQSNNRANIQGNDDLNSIQLPNINKKEDFLNKDVESNKYGEPLYLTKEEMNGWLSKNGFQTLPDRYFSDENQFKIVGICPDAIYKHGNFYAIIPFQVQLPNGKEFCYPLQINCNSVQSFGIVYVPMIGDKFVLVQESRAGAAKKLWGFPRGFPELESSGDTINVEGVGAVNANILLREFGEEVCKNINTADVKAVHLGRIFENSSTSLTSPDYVSIQFPADLVPDGGTEGLKVGLFSFDEVKKMIQSGEICDAHSCTAWGLFSSQQRNI